MNCATATGSADSLHGVLFLGVHNAARSQMAEGWARDLLPPEIGVWSAGSDPASQVDPRATEAMREVQVDMAGQHPKRISDVPLGRIDTVITLCAEELCVTLPGIVRRETWLLPDPASAAADQLQAISRCAMSSVAVSSGLPTALPQATFLMTSPATARREWTGHAGLTCVRRSADASP